MPNYQPFDLIDPFGIDANSINPNIPPGIWTIVVHKNYRNKPLSWFTPKQIESMIRKQLAYVIHNVTIDDNKTDNGSDDTTGQ